MQVILKAELHPINKVWVFTYLDKQTFDLLRNAQWSVILFFSLLRLIHLFEIAAMVIKSSITLHLTLSISSSVTATLLDFIHESSQWCSLFPCALQLNIQVYSKWTGTCIVPFYLIWTCKAVSTSSLTPMFIQWFSFFLSITKQFYLTLTLWWIQCQYWRVLRQVLRQGYFQIYFFKDKKEK